MKIYFLSSTPCELTLNGVFFGVTDSFERFAEVILSDGIFAKFTPQNGLPIGVFLNEQLLSAPPLGVEVYLLKDGVALFAKDFPPSDFTLRPICQERFGDILVTLFSQGSLYLSVQMPDNFFVTPLPPSFATCKLALHDGLLFAEGDHMLAVYTKKGECVFFEKVLAYEVHEKELNATLPLFDSLGRVAECSFVLSETGCQRTSFTLKQARTLTGDVDKNMIEAELLAYAFFESVLLGADYAQFLADELLPKKEELVDFLGDFVSVTPTKDPFCCGLVRKKAERLFEVIYYTIERKNNKIIDIRG